jgi:hypothetical protein
MTDQPRQRPQPRRLLGLSRLRAWMVLPLAGAVIATLAATPASADPINSPHAITFPVTCNGVDVTVVVPSPNALTPRIIIDGPVLVPVFFQVTATDLTTNQVIFSGSLERAYGAQATVTCTATEFGVDESTGHPLRFDVVSVDLQAPPS